MTLYLIGLKYIYLLLRDVYAKNDLNLINKKYFIPLLLQKYINRSIYQLKTKTVVDIFFILDIYKILFLVIHMKYFLTSSKYILEKNKFNLLYFKIYSLVHIYYFNYQILFTINLVRYIQTKNK
jgi:hypothetical protein